MNSCNQWCKTQYTGLNIEHYIKQMKPSVSFSYMTYDHDLERRIEHFKSWLLEWGTLN